MSSTGPLVSVIIPTFNKAQFIEEAVESVLGQTYRNLEIIVVDDGSTDHTRDVLRKYKNGITYLCQNNRGPSSARNYGVRTARADHLAFLDADDVWFPEKLEAQMELMLRHPTVGWVGCGAYATDSEGTIEKQYIPARYQTRQEFVKDLQSRKLSFNPSIVLVKRECMDRVGGFNDALHYGEDWDLWLRIAKHYEVAFIRKALVKVRKYGGERPYQQLELMKSNIHRIIDDNLNDEGWRTRGPLYSALYLDLARLCLEKNRRGMAALYALRSLLFYPLRLAPGDHRFKLLVQAVLPRFLYSAIKTIRQRCLAHESRG
jgi:glycosyltransferase involved in cell wall biosynthesis